MSSTWCWSFRLLRASTWRSSTAASSTGSIFPGPLGVRAPYRPFFWRTSARFHRARSWTRCTGWSASSSRPTKVWSSPFISQIVDVTCAQSALYFKSCNSIGAMSHFSSFPVPDKRCYWEVNRKRPNTPAVTLSLLRTEGNSDELISVDVVPALEVNLTWWCYSVSLMFKKYCDDRGRIVLTCWLCLLCSGCRSTPVRDGRSLPVMVQLLTTGWGRRFAKKSKVYRVTLYQRGSKVETSARMLKVREISVCCCY